VRKNYDHLLQMVEDIINTTDSIGIENINEIRETPEAMPKMTSKNPMITLLIINRRMQFQQLIV
jgi:hypothetical protein